MVVKRRIKNGVKKKFKIGDRVWNDKRGYGTVSTETYYTSSFNTYTGVKYDDYLGQKYPLCCETDELILVRD